MADKPKIGPQEASAYLEVCKPGLMLGEWLGGGGFGDVYELRGGDVSMAVKIMDTRLIVPGEANAMIKNQRREAKKSLDEEVKVMELLHDCRNIMPLLDYYDVVPDKKTGSSTFVKLLFMPKLVPLNQYIGDRKMEEEEVLELLRDITAALTACADHEIIHLDLKPDNIYVDLGGERPCYVLGDFGICQRKNALQKSRCKLWSNTPYRAPECMSESEELGLSADIYSLGVVAYECLEQKLPYPAGSCGQDLQIPVIGHISQDLFDVLTLMLQREPKKRCDHPRNLAEHLEGVSRAGARWASRREYAAEARSLLLENKLEEAVRVAGEGIKNREVSCQRLIAVAAFKKASDKRRGCAQAVSILADLCLEEDMASIFLRGYFAGAIGDWADYIRDMKITAENGFIPGCYLYGRALLYGEFRECPGNPKQGMKYLIQAAEAGYFSALRLVRREQDQFPELPLSEALQRRLAGEEFSRTDPRERSTLYEWL